MSNSGLINTREHAEPIMKDLTISEKLFDDDQELITGRYCAPVFISSAFFGVFLERDENLIPDRFDKDSVRSGTLTFIEYNGEFFAITCNHVLQALEKRQREWKDEQARRFGNEPPMEGVELFTPRGQSQHHFNYRLRPVPKDSYGNQPDVAIARINHSFIKSIERRALPFSQKSKLPNTGIATGYPEMQRAIRKGRNLDIFSPKCIACTASLQVTDRGNLLLQDSIQDHQGLDILSGMSGGPIIWSNENNYGFAGIVTEGSDVQPKEGQLTIEPGIMIHGERITTDLFDNWLISIPPLKELENKTKYAYIPKGMMRN